MNEVNSIYKGCGWYKVVMQGEEKKCRCTTYAECCKDCPLSNTSYQYIGGINLSSKPDYVGISSTEYQRLRECEAELEKYMQRKDYHNEGDIYALRKAKEAFELIYKKHTDLAHHNRYPSTCSICKEALAFIEKALGGNEDGI